MRKFLITVTLLAFGGLFGVAGTIGYFFHTEHLSLVGSKKNGDDDLIQLGERYGKINLTNIFEVGEKNLWKFKAEGKKQTYLRTFKNEKGGTTIIKLSRYPNYTNVYERMVGPIVFSNTVGEALVYVYKIDVSDSNNRALFSKEFLVFEGHKASEMRREYAISQRNNMPFIKKLFTHVMFSG